MENEKVESGHVDAQPTQDLTDAREKALAEHKSAVEQHAEHLEDSTKPADEPKYDYLEENPPVRYDEPFKDERASAPVQVDTPTHVTTEQEVPERHEHSAHDVDGRDLDVADANFDAEERKEDKA